jgi:hypothetical protein
MGYAIQMVEKQASGPPKVVQSDLETWRALEDVIEIAKARIKTAIVPGTNIWEDVGTGAVFIRVVELDSDGSPTEQVVFEKTLADKGS